MKPDVERNMAVRIFFISNGAVMITIDGTALADGMTKAITLMSKTKIIKGLYRESDRRK